MEILDLMIIAAIGGFILYGFISGFVGAAASLLGVVFSAIVSTHIYVEVAKWILPDALSSRFWAQMIVFCVIFSVMSGAVQMLVKLINKAFKLISVVPFTKTANRVLGMALGLSVGIVAVSAVIYASTMLPSLPESFDVAINESAVARAVLFLSSALILLFPDAVDKVRSLVAKV